MGHREDIDRVGQLISSCLVDQTAITRDMATFQLLAEFSRFLGVFPPSHVGLMKSHFLRQFYVVLAVSTCPPAGDLSRCALYCLGPAGLCPSYLSRFALEFSRPLQTSVRIFVSYRTARSILSALRASVRRIYRASHSNLLGPYGPL